MGKLLSTMQLHLDKNEKNKVKAFIATNEDAENSNDAVKLMIRQFPETQELKDEVKRLSMEDN